MNRNGTLMNKIIFLVFLMAPFSLSAMQAAPDEDNDNNPPPLHARIIAHINHRLDQVVERILPHIEQAVDRIDQAIDEMDERDMRQLLRNLIDIPRVLAPNVRWIQIVHTIQRVLLEAFEDRFPLDMDHEA